MGKHDEVTSRKEHANTSPILITCSNLSKIFGTGYSKRAIISSASLSIVLLFYPLSMASIFNPDIYRFIERTTYHQFFESSYFFSELVDNLIILLNLLVWILVSAQPSFRWIIVLLLTASLGIGFLFISVDIIQISTIVSLPFVISLYVLNNRVADYKILYNDSGKFTLNYFCIFIIVLALNSIYLSTVDSDTNDPFMDIMTLLARYSHIVLFLVIFSCFLRVIAREILHVMPYKKFAGIFRMTKPFDIPNFELSKRSVIGLLSLCIMISLLIVLIPQLDNRDYKVAVDTSSYETWIMPMHESEHVADIIQIAFLESPTGSEGDRPLSLLILYALSLVSNAVYSFEIILPVILAPILVLCVFFLTKELTNSSLVAILSSFITAVSFQVMIGLYAGYYANWIALVFGYSSLLFGIRFLNSQNRWYLIGMSVSMLLLLLSHIYTWTIITVFFIIFLLVLRWRKTYESRPIMMIMVVIVCIIVIDLSRSYFVGLTSGFQHDIGIAETNAFGLSDRWSTLVGTVQVHLGGIFGNAIILMLALYTGISFKSNNIAYSFIMVFLAIGIVPLFIGDRIVQSRVLYDIPFQIPAGLALSNLLVTRDGRLKSIAIAISIFAISFYTMNNFGVAPS